MGEAKRKTYCDVIGDVPWGTHICLFYHTKKDLLDILVPYFKAGLEQNEFCIWVTSEPLLAEEAKRGFQQDVNDLERYLERGQIEFLDDSQGYTTSGVFDADTVLQGWVEKEQDALKRGFDGLRLTGNTFWLEKKDWKAFTEYEAAVDSVIGTHRMLSICTYSLEQCGTSEVIEVVSNHACALIKQEGQWKTFESAKRKRAEEALRTKTDELGERVKKLNCLYDIAHLVEKPGISLTKVLQGTVERIAAAWQYPDITCARVVFEDQEFTTKHFKATPWKQAANIIVDEKLVGRLEVGYLEERPVYDEGPFLKEERSLLNAIVKRLGQLIEQKRAEEALRESEDRYRRITEAVTDYIFTVRIKNGQPVETIHGPGCVAVTRYTPKDFASDPYLWIRMVPEADRTIVREQVRRVLAGQEVQPIEHWIVRKDGITRWVRNTLVPHYDPQGKLLSYDGLIQDITDRKQSEEELKKTSKELADIQQELIQSETLAALGGFASGMAHEIKNPLTNIQISAQYCLNTNSLKKETKEFLRIILRNAEKANRTIEELLDFAKPNQLSFKPGDIVQVIRRTCDLTKARRAHQKVRLHKRCARRLPSIMMDERRIEQVFLNCIVNALDAMKNGGCLSITVFPEGEDVVITVSDTGIGIREHDLEKIFTPFFTTKPSGFGLGLSLSRRLIQLHKGNMSITSRVHEGTQLTIRLPMLSEKPCKEPENGDNSDRR